MATSVGGVPEILHPFRNAILVEPDSESLAEGIKRLMDDRDLSSRMATSNFEDVARFSWSAAGAAYAELYEDVLRSY